MDPTVWFPAAAAVLIAVHVAIAVYLYRTTTDADGPGAGRTAPEESSSGSRPGEVSVSCPSCGAPNEPGYQFCRNCVADMRDDGAAVDGPDSTGRLGS